MPALKLALDFEAVSLILDLPLLPFLLAEVNGRRYSNIALGQRYQAGDGKTGVVEAVTLNLDDVLQAPLLVNLAGLEALHRKRGQAHAWPSVSFVQDYNAWGSTYNDGERVVPQYQALHLGVQAVGADNDWALFYRVPVSSQYCPVSEGTGRP